MNQIAIKILYDNQKENPKMQEGWGFSCLIEINNRKILFDTGADKSAFFANLQYLGINLENITDIVFSHKHSDHVAGWQDILSLMKKNVRLFLPKGFPTPPPSSSIEAHYVSDFIQLDAHVYSLVLKGGFRLYEQALILRSNRGLVVITGCAHPGIIPLLETTKNRLDEPIHLVIGGFHLFRKSHKAVRKKSVCKKC